MIERQPSRRDAEPSGLGTLGWVGAVVFFALLAVALLSWLGPVSGR